MHRTDTIVAVSSPIGNSLKGIIRLSGPRALTLVQNAIDKPINRKTWSSVLCTLTIRLSPQHTFNNVLRSTFGVYTERSECAPRFCRIPATLYLMPAPRSYTREDVVEIHTFGSKILLEGILQYFIRAGARLARPGEFTKRAFLNGRISLSQSEAVMNIIHSSTEREHRLAVNQLHQHSFRQLREINRQLLDLVSRLELALDFSDQDIEIISPKQITGWLNRIINAINKTLKESSGYSATTDGITCVLCGRPNTGKSSLFNCLVRDRRNIVSPVPGTTRDYIEGKFIHKNTAFRMFDTAGINTPATGTPLPVRQADVYLLVIDASIGFTKQDRAIIQRLDQSKTILVFNKTDLRAGRNRVTYGLLDPACLPLAGIVHHSSLVIHPCSARTGSGILALKNILVERAKSAPPERSSDRSLTNLRQQGNLKTSLELLNKALSCAKKELPYEFIGLDLKDALEQLNLALGSFSSGKNIAPDDILNNIFSRFCVGK
jgi:tRNA modification GTPase